MAKTGVTTWHNCIICEKRFYYDERVFRCARCSRVRASGGGDLVKECQYCNEESFYVIPIPWVHRYLTKNKKGEEKSRSEARQMKLHLCAYHYDKWRSQNVTDM